MVCEDIERMLAEDKEAKSCFICLKPVLGRNKLQIKGEEIFVCDYHAQGVLNFVDSLNKRTKTETREANRRGIYD